MSLTGKQYGLIGSEKKKLNIADVFNANSDAEEDSNGEDVKRKKQQDAGRGLKKQTIIDMNRALEQDATVYQYDEVYDSMKKAEEIFHPKQERKAKYMEALIKSADRRKKDNERRTERMAQKEREAEGDMYKDKEEYVTSAYKAKLEEMKQAEEEEKRLELIESMTDVTNQKDMGSFYRQFYKDTIDPISKELDRASPEPMKHSSGTTSNTSGSGDGKGSKVKGPTLNAIKSISDDLGENTTFRPEKKEIKGRELAHSGKGDRSDEVDSAQFSTISRKDRNYRQRSSPKKNDERCRSRSRERTRGRKSPRMNERNRGRERDRGKWEGGSRSFAGKHLRGDEIAKRENEIQCKDNVPSSSRGHFSKPGAKSRDAKGYCDFSDANDRKKPRMKRDLQLDNPSTVNSSEGGEKYRNIESNSTADQMKPKISIWEKRTIGNRFDDALQRYFSRKA